MAPTCFGLQPSSGSLQLSLAKVILILKHSVRLRRNLLCGGAQHTIHTPYWDVLPYHHIINYDVTLLNVLISI
jgi:hypothetical protein